MLDYNIEKAEALVDSLSASYKAGREAFRTNTNPSEDFNEVRAEKTYALMPAKKRTETELQRIINSYLDDIPSGQKLIHSIPGDKRIITDAIDREKNDYRFGFIDELVDFLVDKKMDFSSRHVLSQYIKEMPEPAGKRQHKDVLKTKVSGILLKESGLTGYKRGFMMINPNTWLVDAFQDTRTSRLSRSGYELGFRVRVMKDYSYPMDQLEVPTDDTILYFLEGLGKIHLGLSDEFKDISSRFGSLLLHDLPSIEDQIIEHQLEDDGTVSFSTKPDKYSYQGRHRMEKVIFKSPQQKAFELGRSLLNSSKGQYSMGTNKLIKG